MAFEPDQYKVNKDEVGKIIRKIQRLGCAVRILEKRVLEFGQVEQFPDDGYHKPSSKLYDAMRRVQDLTEEICDDDYGLWVDMTELIEEGDDDDS